MTVAEYNELKSILASELPAGVSIKHFFTEPGIVRTTSLERIYLGELVEIVGMVGCQNCLQWEATANTFTEVARLVFHATSEANVASDN